LETFTHALPPLFVSSSTNAGIDRLRTIIFHLAGKKHTPLPVNMNNPEVRREYEKNRKARALKKKLKFAKRKL